MEQTVEEKLKGLYHLQRIYSKLTEIQILKGELPIEVSDLEDMVLGLETRIQKLDAELAEMEQSVSGYRGAIKDAESLILKYNKQLDNVKNNREFDALNKEIEMQKLEIQLAEKRIRESAEGIEAKKAFLEESKGAMEGKKGELEEKQKELGHIITETEKEEAQLEKEAAKQGSQIEERLLTAFNRIRKAYSNKLAVVKIDRDSCGGCFASIPPQRQQEIRQHKKIIVCENCGRVLVDPDIDGNEAE